MTKPKEQKALDAIADVVLAYRPVSRSEPARQRKRRRTILEKKREPKRCERCGTVQRGEYNQYPTCRNTAACERRAATKAR
jgi:hypothetical protein